MKKLVSALTSLLRSTPSTVPAVHGVCHQCRQVFLLSDMKPVPRGRMSCDACRAERALEAAGVEFTTGGQPGVRLASSAASQMGGAIDTAEPDTVRSGKKGSHVQDEDSRRALVAQMKRSRSHEQ